MNTQRKSTVRPPYVRPMQGWWRRDSFFVRYMVREATAIAVLVYAIVLAVGVMRLAQGDAAWNGLCVGPVNEGENNNNASSLRWSTMRASS